MSQSGERVRLSVAMIVRNAMEAVGESLRSIAGIADEIVVLDTGSSDETIRVALENSAQVIQRAWDDNFSSARNAVLQKITGDWVLWLDAGETISNEDAQNLRRFVDQQADATKAYALLIKVPQASGSISGEQVARVRLVPNVPGIQFAGRVRESMSESLQTLGIETEGLPFRIRRGSREHDPQVKVRRARRNLLLADLEIKESGPQARLLNCIGDAMQSLGDTKQAAEYFRKAMSTAIGGSTDMLDAYYGLITSLDGDPSNRQVQVAVCLQALETYPLDSQLLCAMGGYLQAQGRLDLAIRSYQTAYQYGSVDPSAWHLDEIREIAGVCHALALQLSGDADAASKFLETAIAENRDCLRLHRALIDLHVKSGRRVEALAQTRTLPASMPNVEAFRSAVRGACLANEKNWIAARAYLETAYNAGCREPLCLRWYVATLVALGQHDVAAPILMAWRDADPGNAEVQNYIDVVDAATKPAALEIPNIQEYLDMLKQTPPTGPAASSPSDAVENEPGLELPAMPGTGVSRFASSQDRLRRVDTKAPVFSVSPGIPTPHATPSTADNSAKK